MKKPIKNSKEKTSEVLPSDDVLLTEEIEPMKRSRLQESRVSRTKRNIILILLGIVAILLFMLFFGLQLLINFSLFVGNLRGDTDQVAISENNKESFVPRPIINSTVKATKESSVDIKGSAQNAAIIELFVNGTLTDKKKIGDSEFTFTKVPLKEGENRIKARGVEGKNKSEFSETIRVIYREKSPELDIETPRDGDAFSGGVSALKVKGKSTPYAKVTINGVRAISDDTGTFRYDYRMQSGENKLTVTATDEADNKTDREIKFTYSP